MLDRILDPSSSIREVAPSLYSCLDAADEGAPYDAIAAALPLRAGSIATVLCHGAYHVFPETTKIVSEWRRVLEDQGSLFVSSLVRGRWLGDRYLGALYRAGEVTEPRSARQFTSSLESEYRKPACCEVIGNFAYARS